MTSRKMICFTVKDFEEVAAGKEICVLSKMPSGQTISATVRVAHVRSWFKNGYLFHVDVWDNIIYIDDIKKLKQ